MKHMGKKPFDVNDVNIFTHPKYMKVWAQQFNKACGSDTFNVAPDMKKLRFLMDKFVIDYNYHLEQLGEEE
jgi:hypothetical protein|tara:strand:+ start:382 stop:594 length:213 start_codon:yes stop_codon:yes gene_type:complete